MDVQCIKMWQWNDDCHKHVLFVKVQTCFNLVHKHQCHVLLHMLCNSVFINSPFHWPDKQIIRLDLWTPHALLLLRIWHKEIHTLIKRFKNHCQALSHKSYSDLRSVTHHFGFHFLNLKLYFHVNLLHLLVERVKLYSEPKMQTKQKLDSILK